MLQVCFDCYGTYTTDSVYQWDLNRRLAIRGLDYNSAPTIHFSNKKSTEALVVQSSIEDGVIYCDVPNILLQESYDIVGYVCETLDQELTTYETIRIPVKPRVKPADYVYSDNVDILTYYSLMSEITSVKASTEKKVKDLEVNTEKKINDLDASKASKLELNAVKVEVENKINIDILNVESEIDEVEKDVNNVRNEIATERARIDQIVQLPEGSTTGDAELLDIRLDVNGTTHGSAGTAVRSQIQGLDSKIDNAVSQLSSDMFALKSTLPNGTDLNTFKEHGYYFIASGNTYNNMPEDIDTESAGLLLNFCQSNNSGRHYQIIFKYNSSAIYVRHRIYGGDFKAWEHVNKSKIYWGNLSRLANETDLDTLTKEGYYFIASGDTYYNIPEDVTGGMLLNYCDESNPSARHYQIIFKYSSNLIYTRHKIYGSGFTNWNVINGSANTMRTYTVKKVSDTLFYIYRNCASGKIRYKYHNNVDSNINLNTWQMGEIFLCDASGNGLKQISADGFDNEGVLKIKGESDYVGGIHGDEQFTDLAIFIDGKEYTPETIPNVNADEVRICVKSTITHADTTNICMNKTKQTTFDSAGVHVKNRWYLLEDMTISQVCGNLLSINKSCIAKYYDSNVHTFPEPIPETGGDWLDIDITDTYYMGDISAYVWRGETGSPEDNIGVNIADFETRMKSYFYTYMNYSASNGEVIYTNNHFNILC